MKIALCIPCYDGRVHDALMSSVVKTMRLAADKGVEIMLLTGRGSPVLPDVRNWCVAMSLAAKCDKIWFVDSDIAWENCVPDVLNMLLAPVEIVAGVHQKRNPNWNDPAELVVQWDHIPPAADPETGLWEVKSVATAFVCIDRSVFDRLAESGIAQLYLPNAKLTNGDHLRFYRNYFWYDFIPAPEAARADLLAMGYVGPMQILRGEDFYFCAKAREVGARTFVDPRIELVHFDGCVQHNASLKQVRFEPEGEI
jgi:hypothetical protein